MRALSVSLCVMACMPFFAAAAKADQCDLPSDKAVAEIEAQQEKAGKRRQNQAERIAQLAAKIQKLQPAA